MEALFPVITHETGLIEFLTSAFAAAFWISGFFLISTRQLVLILLACWLLLEIVVFSPLSLVYYGDPKHFAQRAVVSVRLNSSLLIHDLMLDPRAQSHPHIALGMDDDARPVLRGAFGSEPPMRGMLGERRPLLPR